MSSMMTLGFWSRISSANDDDFERRLHPIFHARYGIGLPEDLSHDLRAPVRLSALEDYDLRQEYKRSLHDHSSGAREQSFSKPNLVSWASASEPPSKRLCGMGLFQARALW